jgi:hypothetical protein
MARAIIVLCLSVLLGGCAPQLCEHAETPPSLGFRSPDFTVMEPQSWNVHTRLIPGGRMIMVMRHVKVNAGITLAIADEPDADIDRAVRQSADSHRKVGAVVFKVKRLVKEGTEGRTFAYATAIRPIDGRTNHLRFAAMRLHAFPRTIVRVTGAWAPEADEAMTMQFGLVLETLQLKP